MLSARKDRSLGGGKRWVKGPGIHSEICNDDVAIWVLAPVEDVFRSVKKEKMRVVGLKLKGSRT